MALFLTILMFLSTIIFIIMMIYVLARAVRFGENIPERTNRTFILGVVAGSVSVLSAVLKMALYGGNVLLLIAAVICYAFAFAFKRAVYFFEDDFDKKHQISVVPDEKVYFFSKNDAETDDYLDENSRFNGDFTHFDNR